MRFLSRIEEEAIEEGFQQGVLQTLRGSVIELLEIRFQEVSPELNETLNNIDELSILKQLLRQAITVNSLS